MKNINEATPIFSKENLLYFRDEKEGFMTFIPKKHPETMEMVINPTSKQILEMCDGQKSIDDIINIFHREYPNVSIKQLQLDITRTMKSYALLGVVTWKTQNPFLKEMKEEKSNGYYITVGYESHLEKLLYFLQSVGFYDNAIDQENYHYSCNPFLIKEQEYSDLSLRQKLFSFSEDFFILWKDDKIESVFSISTSHINKNKQRSGTVNLVIAKKEAKFFDMILDYTLKVFPIFAITEPTKVKYISEEKDNEITDKLQKSGFVLEYSLRNEFDFETKAFVYSHFFKKNQGMRLREKITT